MDKQLEVQAKEDLVSLSTEVICAAIKGDINLLELMRQQLADSGISAKTGKWVGFEKAAEELANKQ